MAEEVQVASELSGLRREIYEVRNLVIRTDNLLKNFSLELKDVAKKQAQSERRHFAGHVAAYIAIAVIAAGGAISYGAAASRASRQEATALLEDARQKLAQAESAERTARENEQARELANSEAVAVWELITSPDPAKQQVGLERAAKIDPQKLSTFARSVIGNTAGTMLRTRAEEAYNNGINEYRRGNISNAKTLLERFLALSENLPADWKKAERQLAQFHLGAAYNQLGLHTQAIPHLQQYVKNGDSASNKAYAYLLLGDSLEATRQPKEAKEAYRAGLDLGPSGYTGMTLRHRLEGTPAPQAPTPVALPQG